ncbi:MAG TPA: hypothetical protein VLG28_17495 [Acidimicrobiia bacterium]|jgi:hypothetical protein|nr:hypothetical protein [Acidimicrobiia bacterium]
MKAHGTNASVEADEVVEWFVAQLQGGWSEAAPEISVDGDEILVMLRIADVELAGRAEGEELLAARKARISNFREETRGKRVEIAAAAEVRFDRKVSWGVRCGDVGVIFTHLSIPAMTRLRIKERMVLDTLIDAGVARSRSDALAWCVRLVGKNLDEWLQELRDAMVHVEEVRKRGPEA